MLPTDNSPVLILGIQEDKLLDGIAYLYIVLGAVISMGVSSAGSPYGRYSDSRFGFGVPGRLAWFVQELPSFAVSAYLLGGSKGGLINGLLLSLFIIHYFQRTFIFTYLIRGGKPTPFFTFIGAFVFCLVNGYLQGRYLTRYAVYDDNWQWDPRFWFGVVVFFTGMAINIQADSILRNLRKPGETGYKIPKGGMFEYVSGANFFGEFVEWTGFAIACWSLQGLAFAIFTISNTGPRAIKHHDYYQKKFENYPKSRKAIIPFLI